jgi:hypothetical protein
MYTGLDQTTRDAASPERAALVAIATEISARTPRRASSSAT